MGMFSSLFGSSGSDKADKFRQEALDAFNAVKTPDLSALQVQLQNAVVAGKISPEEAEAQLLNSNAFDSIKTDPSLAGAQKQALLKLQQTGQEGGLDAIDKSKLQAIRDQQEQENHSSNEAIMANARARGTGNSNLNTVNSLIQQQGAADRASRAGTDVAAQAQSRALQALIASGNVAKGMEDSQFASEAAKATSQNEIDKFNAANKNDMSKFNVTNDLNAQSANTANAQHVSDTNTATKNAETVHNADQNQTVFNDEMGKASGKAGVLNGWAGDATAAKARETGADMALTGGAINAGAGAIGYGMAGPAGAATTGAETAPMGYKPKVAPNQYAVLGYADGGEVKDPASSSIEDEYDKFMQSFSCGGTVKMADGGSVTIKPGMTKKPVQVPGVAPVQGDSPANDIVDAKVSPGEYIVPRTDVAEIEQNTGDPMAAALKRLKNPQVGSVRG